MEEFDPNQMPRTNRHAIRYPGGTDLVKYASQQFKAMAESIDDQIDTLPAEVSQLVTSSANAAQDAQRKAENAAATAGTLADQNMSDNIVQATSKTRTALKQWYDSESTSRERITLVCFGDSYASSIANSWAVELQKMIPNSVLKNFAVGGAGFNVDTRTFLNQLNTAKNDASISKTSDKVIIVLAGGRNDILSYNEAVDKGAEWATAARVAYPNARILVAPLLWDSSPTPSATREKYSGIVYGMTNTANVEVIPYAYLWLKGLTDMIQSDGIHPNNLGSSIIARYLLAAINGSYTPRGQYAARNLGNAKIDCTLSGGMVTLNWNGSMPNIGQGKSNSLPLWAAPSDYRWTVGVSGPSGSRQTLYQVSVDEKVLLIYTPTAADQGFVGGSITYPA